MHGGVAGYDDAFGGQNVGGWVGEKQGRWAFGNVGGWVTGSKCMWMGRWVYGYVDGWQLNGTDGWMCGSTVWVGNMGR